MPQLHIPKSYCVRQRVSFSLQKFLSLYAKQRLLGSEILFLAIVNYVPNSQLCFYVMYFASVRIHTYFCSLYGCS